MHFILTNMRPINTLNRVAIKNTLLPKQFTNMTKSPAERLLYVLRWVQTLISCDIIVKFKNSFVKVFKKVSKRKQKSQENRKQTMD